MVYLLVYAILPSVLLWVVTPSVADTCKGYTGYPGVPGIPGTPGTNGKHGPSGEKGDSGEDTQPVKGAKGEMGEPGRPGRPGPRGGEGAVGLPGQKGQKGLKGIFQMSSDVKPVFFSNKRSSTSRTSVTPNRIVEFEDVVSSEKPGDRMIDGLFRAKQSGIYYFVYHVSASQTACLCIKHQDKEVLKMCDFSNGVLLSSGSVVLDIKKDETVGVYVCTKSSQIFGKETDSTFTGFLLFPS